ncbi:MAG: D-inositol-3-phosphate glycosyltransferase [Bacteroidia bacterium]|nr:D-inositol-3-phosphate glycosyltransferase [Bacteroidia bacterium]
MAVKVCHFTSAHPRYDIRIFIKECKSLSAAGYDVTLVVADGKGNETNSGVRIIDAGKSNGRLSRMTRTVWRVYKKAIDVDADIYHFHDPELMMVAWLLKLKGKKIIYDVHEDLPRQLFAKAYLGKTVASILSLCIERIENFFSSRFNGIITVTPFIRDRFIKSNSSVEIVSNFPLLSEFSFTASDEKHDEICYVGSITEERGILLTLKAMEKINARLNLAGTFGTTELRDKCEQLSGWQKVNEFGFLNRTDVLRIIARSQVGLSVLKELPNYVNAYPIKIFEYMAAGIPVVASDFPLWKEIVEGNNCGICVPPHNTEAIADAVNRLLNDKKTAQQMGENGKKAVKEKYNWEAESLNLLSFYKKLQ